MVRVTDRADGEPGRAEAVDTGAAPYQFAGSAVAAAVVGALLAWTARIGALELLVAVAAVQALVAVCWVYGLRAPGRNGALLIAALTAATADVTVSIWPQGRLGALVAVLALAVPVMFVHQLARGAARVRVMESLGSTAVLLVAVVSLPALLQLRHEFGRGAAGGEVASGVVVVIAAALVVGFLIDLMIPAPRFDERVPRGLLAVVGSTAVGAAVGELTLRGSAEFVGGRAVFVGAALGVLVGLVAVASTFFEHGAPPAPDGIAARVRPGVSVLLPICILAPVAFLLCLAVRA
jgi:hypothetical protein